jgi:hypothetical protein
MSWAQLKEKFLVNVQGFQVDITTEEDFFLLPAVRKGNFARLFLKITSAKSVSSESLK